MEENSNYGEWKEIAIMKLLFPSTLYFLRDLKVEGNRNENGRKQQFLVLEKTKMEWDGMEGNSNTPYLLTLDIYILYSLEQFVM